MIFAAALALVWRSDLFLRRAWVAWVALTVTLVTVVALSVGITTDVVALPVTVAGWIAAVMLAVGVVWSSVAHTAADPILDPLHGDPEPRTTRLLTALHPWFFVAMTLVGVLMILVI